MNGRVLGVASLLVSSLALGVVLFSGGEEPLPPASDAAAFEPSSVELEDLQDRIEGLEALSKRLAERVTRLEHAPVGTVTGAPASSAQLQQEVEKLRGELQSLMVGETMTSPGGRDALKEAVRAAQDEMRDERRREIEERWVQSQTQGAATREARWKGFVAEAKLNYSQEQTLKQRMEAEETRRKALFEELRAGTKDMRQLRQELRTVRRDTDTVMSTALDAQQRQQYQRLRREELRGPSRTRGGSFERRQR